MRKILIATTAGDPHALVVAEALRRLGHRAVLWCGEDFPGRQEATVAIDDDRFSWRVYEDERDFGGDGFDVVWMRRLTEPAMPDGVPEEDREFVARELRQFYGALWHALEPQAFQVNPLGSLRPGESKILQLRTARACGMTVPPTSISNRPEDIRAFLRRHEAGGTIYKAFLPAAWESPDGRRTLPTTPVRLDDLPSDAMLRAVPGIFQARIEKAHEIRLTMFGDHPLAVKLDSQRHEAGTDDWRVLRRAVPVEPAAVPEALLAQVRDFMRRIGIVFGCFDFIVRPDGGHVFLEVNQAGQFLWIEQLRPDIPMLATFCGFLAHAGRDYDGSLPAMPPRLSDIAGDLAARGALSAVQTP